MKPSLLTKLQQMVDRREEIAGELSTPQVLGDPDKFRRLSQEYAQLGPVVESFSAFSASIADADCVFGPVTCLRPSNASASPSRPLSKNADNEVAPFGAFAFLTFRPCLAGEAGKMSNLLPPGCAMFGSRLSSRLTRSSGRDENGPLLAPEERLLPSTSSRETILTI